MATTGVTGGSQIDVLSLVQQLVSAERKAQDDQIARENARVTTSISALGTLMGSMSTFRNAVSSMRSAAAFAAKQAVSSDTAVFTATANGSAAPGTYDIEVVQLAKAQQLSSNLFTAGAAQTVGTGTLVISLGSASASIEIGSGNATLGGIRDAINNAPGNPGVRAALVRDGDGARLVLTSAVTGAANTIRVSQAGGDGGLSQLTYSPGNQGNYTQQSAAQDAIVRVATFESTSSTNTVANVVDGVTLQLVAEAPGANKTLTVSDDRGALVNRINTFVSAYNALKSQITRLGGYNASTQTAGPMLGDSLLSGIDDQLRRVLQTPVSSVGGSLNTLAAIGITTQADGTLAVNESKLQSAISAGADGIAKLFGAQDGLGNKFFAAIDERLKSNGAVSVRTDNLVAQQKTLQNRKLALDARMETVKANYVRQFTALDRMLSSMQTTSSFLSQQIESLANLNRSASR